VTKAPTYPPAVPSEWQSAASHLQRRLDAPRGKDESKAAFLARQAALTELHDFLPEIANAVTRTLAQIVGS
jgi:hypothetical protein